MSFPPVVPASLDCKRLPAWPHKAALALCWVLATVFCTTPEPSQARPATNAAAKVVQPDGTVVRLKAKGDEWSHWYETPAGNRVAKDPQTKAWVYLTQQNGQTVRTKQWVGKGAAPLMASKLPPPQPSAVSMLRRAGAHTRSVPLPGKGKKTKQPGGLRRSNIVSSTGSGKIPILLATFKDRPVGSANGPVYSPQNFADKLFDSSSGALSMKNMYAQMSGGAFNVSEGPSGISGWYQVPENHDYYGEDSNAQDTGSDRHPDQFVRETVQAADATYNFGPYDTDNDGFVDVVFVVHQGTDQADGGSPTDMWSHRSKLTDWGPFWWGDGAIETNDVNANGVKVKVNDYVVVPELADPTGDDVGKMASVGVYCHEYGHALGLPDLYDVDDSSAGLGGWSLMASGSNNGFDQSGDCPAFMDAWSRWILGWNTATVYTTNERGVEIPEAKANHNALYLWTNGANSNQYFLVENRMAFGFDSQLPNSGLLIYHCDDNVTGNNLDNSREWWHDGVTGNTMNGHPRVRLIEADNIHNLNRSQSSSLGNFGDPNDVFPGGFVNRVWDNTTLPNSRKYNTTSAGFGALTHVALRNISNSGAVMTADLSVRADASVPEVFIDIPLNPSTHKDLSSAKGRAQDDSGVREVRVALRRKADNLFWKWGASWGTTTYVEADNGMPVSNPYDWLVVLPALPDGNYEVRALAKDFSNKSSTWASSLFTVDSQPPTIIFDPLKSLDKVFNLDKIGGNVGGGATSAKFQISEMNGATLNRIWTNAGWVDADVDGNGPWQDATINGTKWTPAAGVLLPTRAQLRPGRYILKAEAWDNANNKGSAFIQVDRTPLDSTPPIISFMTPPSPQADVVLTSPNIPGIGGAVIDDESGISRVYFFIIRDPAGSAQFWNGAGWQAASHAILANYTEATSGWGEPTTGYTRPAGTNLPNGTYQLQAYAYNRESPELNKIAYRNFSVDFHPIYQWTGATLRDNISENNSDSWDTAANWNPTNGGPFGVPGPEAIAVIANGDTVKAGGSRQVYRLDISGGSTLSTTGILLTKALNQNNGHVSGGSVHIASGAVWTWTGGNIGGDWQVLFGATANISGTLSKVLADSTVLSNAGVINWSGSALMANNYNSGATINNLSDGVFNVGTGTLLGQMNGYGYAKLFNNQAGAKFIHTGTSTTGKIILNTWTFRNSGLVESKGGIIEFASRLELEPGNVFSGAGKHQLASGDMVLNGLTTLDGGKFAVLGGTMSDVGNKTGTVLTKNGGRLDWMGGVFAGVLTLDVNSTMGIGDPGTVGVQKILADGSVFNNKGNVTWSGLGPIMANNYNAGAIWNNRGGSTFTATSNASFGIIHGYSYVREFNNEPNATFKKTGGTGTAATVVGWALHNNGLTQVTVGTLDLRGGGATVGASVGTFNTSAGAVLRVSDGTHTFNNAKVNGAGKLSLIGGTVNANGTMTDLTSTGIFEVAGGTLNGVGAGGATLITKGGFNWTSGNLGGVITLGAGSILTASGASNKVFNDGAVFNNFGQVTWAGPGGIYANNNNAGAIWNNENGSSFKMADGVVFNQLNGYNYARVFNNKPGALLVKNTGAATTTLTTWSFTNGGEISSTSGLLEFTSALGLAGGTKFTGLGRIRLAADVTQTGAVTSTGIVSLEGGTLKGAAPAGILASYTGILNWTGGFLAGDWTLTAGSKLNVKDPTSGPTSKVLADGTVLNNFGTVEWSGAGRLVSFNYNDGAIINNEAGAVFRMLNDGNPFGVAHGYNYTKLFNNKAGAKFIKSAGTGSAHCEHFTFNNNGEINVAAGTLNFISRLNLKSGSNLIGSGIVRFGGDVVMESTVNASCKVVLDDGNLHGFMPTTGGTPAVYTGAGLFEWTNGSISGTLTLDVGSQMNIADRTTGATSKVFADSAVFNNKGKVTWSGQGSIVANNYNAGMTWNNIAGSTFVILNDGTVFNVANGYGYAKVFNNAKSASIIKTGGAGTAVIGYLTINNLGDIVGSAGVLDFQTALNLNNGNYISGLSKVTASAGTVTFSGNTMINGTTFVVSGANIVGSAGSLVSGGRFDWTAGTLFGTLSTNVGSNMFIHGTATKVFADNATLINRGNVEWSDGDLSANNYNAGAFFTNMKGATFTMASPGKMGILNGYNYPLLLKNSGVLNVAQSGIAGIAKVDWNFEQTSDGVLNLDLRGKDPAIPQFDQVFVGRSAVLAGTLNLVRPGNYLPLAGDTFKVITFASKTGTFNQVTGTDIDASRRFNVTYNPNDVTLAVAKKIFVISGRAYKSVFNGTQMTQVGIPSTNITLLIKGTTTVYKTGRTDANGNFTLIGVEAGAYTIKAEKTGITFTPSSTGVAVPTANIAGVSPNARVDFQTFSYKAQVVDGGGVGVQGVTIKLFKGTAARGQAITNAQGVVSFEGLSNGSFSVAPVAQSGFTFDLANHAATLPTSGITNVSPNAEAKFVRSPAPPSAPSALTSEVSSVRISATTGSAAASSIRLVFTSGIDFDTAQDLSHYMVTVNGEVLELEGVSVASSSVTLFLPESSLSGGAQFTVAVSGLKDWTGKPITDFETTHLSR